MTYELAGGYYLFLFLTVGVIILFLVWILSSSSSKKYRDFLSDMYVSARIRQLAEQDKLDLQKETVRAKHYRKYLENKERNLAESIEEDLKERTEKTYQQDKQKK